MEREKKIWVVVGVLLVAAVFVLFFNQPSIAAQTGRAASAMVGGC